MHKIGIMQGRVCPAKEDKLQIFPLDWEKELSLIKKLGFEYIELLDDKAGKLRALLETNRSLFLDRIEQSGIKFLSVCMDSLCDYSLIDDKPLFLSKVDQMISFSKGMSNICLVIPFFEQNKLDEKCLGRALSILEEYMTQFEDDDMSFALEIDLDAEVLYEQFNSIRSTNLGVCYDLGNNIDQSRNIYNEIKLLAHYINHVHVKDKKDGENIPLRENSNQLREGFTVLREIGYRGLYVLETAISPNPLLQAERNLRIVKDYMESKY